MIRVYVTIVRKFVNQDLTRIFKKNIFFSNRVIGRWNSLDQDTVDAPSLNCFKNTLNKIRCTKMVFFHGIVRKTLLGLVCGLTSED